MRILSLLPSATEIVYALGLEDDLVGVTHECDWPPAARTKRSVSFSALPAAAEAAEVAVGLAIVLSLYRLRRTVRSDEADLLKN